MQLLNGHVPRAQHFEGDGNSFPPVSDPPPPQSAAACAISLSSARAAAALLATDSHNSTTPVNQNLPASKHKAGGAVIINS